MKSLNMNFKHGILYFSIVILFACQQPGKDITGSEYMPDMAHSIAYEANYYNYYYQNTWGTEDEYYEYAKPKLPVAGTIARGSGDGNKVYHYGDSDAERTRATAELISNPYPITDNGLTDAKELYNVYCGICHGEKGDGAGYLVRDGSAYPVQPANFLLDEFLAASNGRYYHAMMYGKNLMGAYKDKLSYEERWQVIHYIRSLQAKELKLTYNQEVNTLNDIDVPAGIAVVVEEHHDDAEHMSDHHDDESHDASHH